MVENSDCMVENMFCLDTPMVNNHISFLMSNDGQSFSVIMLSSMSLAPCLILTPPYGRSLLKNSERVSFLLIHINLNAPPLMMILIWNPWFLTSLYIIQEYPHFTHLLIISPIKKMYKGSGADFWKSAIKEELLSPNANHIYETIPIQTGITLIMSKPIFHIKWNLNRLIKCCKFCIVL